MCRRSSWRNAASAAPARVTMATATMISCSLPSGSASGASRRSTVARPTTASGTGTQASSSGRAIGGATSVSLGTRRWNGIAPIRIATASAIARTSRPTSAATPGVAVGPASEPLVVVSPIRSPAASGATTIAAISSTVETTVARSSREDAGMDDGSRHARSTTSDTRPVAPAAAAPSVRFVAANATAPPTIETSIAGSSPRRPARPPASHAMNTISAPSSAHRAITIRM